MSNGRSLAKKLLKEKKLKIEGLAFKAGCSSSTVTNWLAGKNTEFESKFIEVMNEVLASEEPDKAAG